MQYDKETRDSISIVLKEADNKLNSARSNTEITCSLLRAAEILMYLTDYKSLAKEIIDHLCSNKRKNIKEFAAQIHWQLNKNIILLNYVDN